MTQFPEPERRPSRALEQGRGESQRSRPGSKATEDKLLCGGMLTGEGRPPRKSEDVQGGCGEGAGEGGRLRQHLSSL